MVNRIWTVIAMLLFVLGVLVPSGTAAPQTPEAEGRTFVGDIAGLENIGAKFVVIVGP